MADTAGNVLSMNEGGESLPRLLSAGCASADCYQNRDALEHFSEALQLDPQCRDAALGYNQVVQRTVPRWHFAMLNDRERNDSFDSALRKAVRGKTVLDVGSGSGLLAMMAARAGAEKVYTCEMNPVIAQVARRIVEANGYSDVVTVFAKKSDAVVPGEDMSEPADVLVTETVDSALLGEGIIPIVRDARARLLREGATIIPCRARMFGALLESPVVWEMNRVDLASGFDVGLFNELSTDGFYPVKLERFDHEFASERFLMCEFDFAAGDLEPREFEIPVKVRKSGVAHSVAYWFELSVDDEVTFSSTPDNLDSHWKQAVQCFSRPIPVFEGESLVLAVRQGLTRFDFELGR